MKQKRQLRKIIISAVLFILGFAAGKGWAEALLFLSAYILVGGDILLKAFRNIIRGRVFDENFLMSVATLGAVALGQYSEAVGVMLFYQIGELFQSYAVNKSRRSVAELMDIRPDTAHLMENGTLRDVHPEKVKIGAAIVVKPGERVPLDGEVISGNSLLDTSALTGEPVPREIAAGEEILSGSVNINGLLEIRVTKVYGESTVSRILDLVENAAGKKARIEQFITRFARWYTPAVVVLALLIAFVPPLLLPAASFHDWVYRALTFLVISCPCALVISVPLSFFGGIGAASGQGILVKGSNYLQALSDAEIMVFDKTGTLTKGTFQVAEISSCSMPKEELLRLAAYAGAHSSHPVSQSIRRAYGEKLDLQKIKNFAEIPAQGVTAEAFGHKIHLGSRRLLKGIGLETPLVEAPGTVVFAAVDGAYAGWIRIADEIKPGVSQALKELKKLGVRETVMLTGDNNFAGQAVAGAIGVDKTYTELLPADKVAEVEKLMAAKTGNGKLVFVGDGINDAPVLARADIGIAMGGIGSDAAVEAADIVLMTDEPEQLVSAVKISRRTLNIVRQNIVFALGIKFAVLALGAAGMATMWEAVFADVGVSVIAILNAIRALKFKK